SYMYEFVDVESSESYDYSVENHGDGGS
ncbi:MAG: hypothetical protein ACI9TV_003195, partial [Sulfurimonas sp.]